MLFYDGESPWKAMRNWLDEWETGFYAHWTAPAAKADASYSESEEAKELEETLRRLHELCERAPMLYETMLTQRVGPALDEALREVAAVPLNIGGFDGRRLQLTPDIDLFWQHLDLALIRDALRHLAKRSDEERQKCYQLLLVAAPSDPISPIASWYLERAARLLLYGLDTECVAMCRAVLEAALRHVLDEEELDRAGVERRVRLPSGERAFDLAGLIYGAHRLKRFDKEDVKRARLIKRHGNEVLHPDDPERFETLRKDPEPRQRVADLAILLRKLFPS